MGDPIAMRSMQRKAGIKFRTRKGTPIKAENDPQNAQAFGADNITAGNGGNPLSAPGAGFCWIITSLSVSFNCVTGGGVRVTFTGGLAAQGALPTGSTAPVPAQTVINAPLAVAANTAFGYSSASTGTAGSTFSISGTAYKATVATITNPATTQVISSQIDSDPAGELQ